MIYIRIHICKRSCDGHGYTVTLGGMLLQDMTVHCLLSVGIVEDTVADGCLSVAILEDTVVHGF